MEVKRKELGLSRGDIARKADLNIGQLNKAGRGLVENPRGDFMKKVAAVLGVSEVWLRHGVDPNARLADDAPPPPSRHEMQRDIPVMGIGTGGTDGAINIDGAVDYIMRPAALKNTRDVYAVFVNGDSMEPRYSTGDPVYASSSRPPGVGDHVVIQCRADDGDLLAFVKVITGRTSTGWRFAQHNPESEWKPPYPVETVHRIFSHKDLFLI
mgnify:CR=1 FL=1